MPATFPARIINHPNELPDVIVSDELRIDFVVFDPEQPICRFRMRGAFSKSHPNNGVVTYVGIVRTMSGSSRKRHPLSSMARRSPRHRQVTLTYLKGAAPDALPGQIAPNAIFTVRYC